MRKQREKKNESNRGLLETSYFYFVIIFVFKRFRVPVACTFAVYSFIIIIMILRLLYIRPTAVDFFPTNVILSPARRRLRFVGNIIIIIYDNINTRARGVQITKQAGFPFLERAAFSTKLRTFNDDVIILF